MSERNEPGLLVIGLLRNPYGQAMVEVGNSADIEYTKRQARNLVLGPHAPCYYAWVVDTRFEVHFDHTGSETH